MYSFIHLFAHSCIHSCIHLLSGFCTGTEAGIKLYLSEIVELLRDTLQSQSWSTKAQAARAMSTVADKLGSNLRPPHLGNLVLALLAGLQGRTWSGKVGSKVFL